MGFPSGSMVKNLPAVQETQEMRVGSLGWEDPLKENIAIYPSILAGIILWTEEPGRLQSVGLQESWTRPSMHAVPTTLGIPLEHASHILISLELSTVLSCSIHVNS